MKIKIIFCIYTTVCQIILVRLHHFSVWRAIHRHHKGCGLAQGWFPDINTNAAATNIGFYTWQGYLIRIPDPKGSFQCAIPMLHIFSFVDDYPKVTYGMQDTMPCSALQLFAGKVVLSKLTWSVPILQPNDVRKIKLYKSIASKRCEMFSLPQASSTVW